MIGWLADLCRLAWGMLYWNAAKARFRWRGHRGRCPCQSPSDSGRAMETTCEASLTWHRQERFRRVCPLLRRDAAGELRCSVDTAGVRPFWGRAAWLYVGTVAGLYLLGTAGYFALQRAVGIPVSYVTITYPPHWPRIDAARSRYFSDRADRALIAGQLGDAEKSLALAYSLDPTHYGAALKLALLYQNTHPALSDDLYARLLHEHPSQRALTATAWYQALLLRGDFTTSLPLVVTALSVDAAHESAWTNALLFVLRYAPAEKLEKLQTRTELPAGPRALLALELLTRTRPPDEARRALLQTPLTSPYADYYRLKRLLDLGFAADVRRLVRTAPQLSPRDRVSLALEACAVLGWGSVLDNEFDQLLSAAPGPITYEVLAAHLIRHPDRARLARVFASLEKQPLADTDAGRAAAMALLCAAGANRDRERFHAAARSVQTLSQGRFRALPATEAFFFHAPKNARIEALLPALQPLSAELNYTLLERYVAIRPEAPAPRPPASTATSPASTATAAAVDATAAKSSPVPRPTPVPTR